MDTNKFTTLKIIDLLRMLDNHEITCEEIMKHYINQKNNIDEDINAWESFNKERVMDEAKKIDSWRQQTGHFLPLLGIPFGIKDIIDAKNYPTTRGSYIFKESMPNKSSQIVSQIKTQGGLIFGKTVTTEFAWKHPSKTRNPWNKAHTPGGSSSGSAAAVASGMVPIAIGSQTLGSTIRPASYCGVIGFKPSYNKFSVEGFSPLSQSLDHAGFFTNNIDDMIYFTSVMIGKQNNEEYVRRKISNREQIVNTKYSKKPLIAFVKTPIWGEIDINLREKILETIKKIESQGAYVELIDIDNIYYSGMKNLNAILSFEAAVNHSDVYLKYKMQISNEMIELVEAGKRVPTDLFLEAISNRKVLFNSLNKLVSKFSVIVTPATFGAAPAGLSSTGDPGLCGLWTFFGLPALSYPISQSLGKMPLSIQFVGTSHDDMKFLEFVKWCADAL